MITLSMRGAKLDMAVFVAANSQKVAIGNAGLNARGDKVTNSGTVLQTREQVMSDYNVSNPKAVRQMGLNSIREEALSPAEAAKFLRARDKGVSNETPPTPEDVTKPSKRKIIDSET